MADRTQARARRRLVVAIAATLVGIAVLFVAALPVTTYLRQRSDTRQSEATLAAVKQERARIEREAARLDTAAAIEERAREELGFRQPDEETYNILPAPTDPLGLPPLWPFAGVERALGAR